MSDTVFLTGATGYIGSSLLQAWLEKTDATIVVLARQKRDKKAAARVESALAALSAGPGGSGFPERIEVVEGDVSFERFGLKAKPYRDLASRVTHIIHCAAAARFDLELDDARKTNVGGTRNILDFGRACIGLRRIDYIGTAYVAGQRRGVILEDELDKGQRHCNTYEHSKMEAEKLVRESMRDLPIAILRPSIVICDSLTGRASNFNGFYRAMRMYSLGLMRAVPGNPASTMDLVPVDYVTEAVYAISNNPVSIGRCYHLTAGLGNAPTLGEIAALASEHFGMEKFAIVPPEVFVANIPRMKEPLTEEIMDRIDEIMLYMPYLNGHLEFDNSNTLRETGLAAPPVGSYFGKMAGYIRATAQG
jgi:long-chain acyl-CoA synthetase